jgi:hypothetical protein
MAWHGWGTDPTIDPAAADVLAAYEAAWEARWIATAGVVAWRQAHPDQKPAYAAQQAVAVILAVKVSLRIDDV